MRLVSVLLFLVHIPMASFAQNDGVDEALENCRQELAQIFEAGKDTPSIVDRNFEIVSDCLSALDRLAGSNSEKAADAVSKSSSALEDAAKVSAFGQRIKDLEWDPQGVLGQIQAQAACIGESDQLSGWITAVPRQCDEQTVSCTEICAGTNRSSNDGQLRNATVRQCFNALHIYRNSISAVSGVPGFKTYKYESCASGGCGPNYCCCHSQ